MDSCHSLGALPVGPTALILSKDVYFWKDLQEELASPSRPRGEGGGWTLPCPPATCLPLERVVVDPGSINLLWLSVAIPQDLAAEIGGLWGGC